jgi:hypothetical protein
MSGKYAYTALPAVVTPLVLPALWNPDWDFPGVAPPGWVLTDDTAVGEDGTVNWSKGRVIVRPLTGLQTTDEGGTDYVYVRLSKRPNTLAAPGITVVTVPIHSSNESVCNLDQNWLDFTSDNWGTEQAVKLTGLHTDGPVSTLYEIHTGPATGGDPLYQDVVGEPALATHYANEELTVFTVEFMETQETYCAPCPGQTYSVCDSPYPEPIRCPGRTSENGGYRLESEVLMDYSKQSLRELCDGLPLLDPSDDEFIFRLQTVRTYSDRPTTYYSHGSAGGIIGKDGVTRWEGADVEVGKYAQSAHVHLWKSCTASGTLCLAPGTLIACLCDWIFLEETAVGSETTCTSIEIQIVYPWAY